METFSRVCKDGDRHYAVGSQPAPEHIVGSRPYSRAGKACLPVKQRRNVAEINASTDIVVTNEMPFGEWLASSEHLMPNEPRIAFVFTTRVWTLSRDLNARIVISSRPVRTDEKLANEAFALHSGEYRLLHQHEAERARPASWCLK